MYVKERISFLSLGNGTAVIALWTMGLTETTLLKSCLNPSDIVREGALPCWCHWKECGTSIPCGPEVQPQFLITQTNKS